ncbi:MAG: hypothetical protein FWG90_03545 [Oscillospiraceae bacterium]|nr:hypothetical protein [Oscillospiraceae bacterium]
MLNRDDYEKELREILEKMDNEQLGKFMTVLSFRNIPCFSEGFIKIVNKEKIGYLNYLLISLMINDVIFFSSTPKALVFARALDLAFARDLAFDCDIALALDHAHARILALALARARDLDLDRVLYLTLDFTLPLDLVLNDAKQILNDDNDFVRYAKETSDWYSIFSNFLEIIIKLNGNHWADLLKRVVDNNFMISKNDAEAILSITKFDVPISVTNAHLAEVLKGIKNLDEARVIILGERGAGKTCLANRLIGLEPYMTKSDESTIEVNTNIWKIKSGDSFINAHIWDFGGDVILHSAHRCFLSPKCVYIIVYDGRSERRNDLEYWLNHVKDYGGNAPVWIFVNRRDNHILDIPIYDLQANYKEISIKLVEFSIEKDNKGYEEFKSDLEEYIRGNPMWNFKTPKSYYNIKNRINELFADGKHYISREIFNQIALDYEAEDSENALINLNPLGICLWYKDMGEFDSLVINPSWLSKGIYKVIALGKHTVSLNDYEAIFKSDSKDYTVEHFQYIFKLMVKFELAYAQTETKIIIPHLLKKDRPPPEEMPDFDPNDSLLMEYKAESPLPPNTVCRLITRRHKEIEQGKVWRSGVVLKYGEDTIATVIENDRTISIKVKGSLKTKYITELRKDMNDIFNGYKSATPDLYYRIILPDELKTNLSAHQKQGINQYQKNASYEPIMLKEKKIVNYIEKKREYYDDDLDRDIPLNLTANLFNINIKLFGLF